MSERGSRVRRGRVWAVLAILLGVGLSAPPASAIGGGSEDADPGAAAVASPPPGWSAPGLAGDPHATTIDVWYGDEQRFGRPGLAQRWINVLGNVADADGIAALSYRLDGGPSRALAVGPDHRRLAYPGDFVVEIAADGLAAGEHEVRIRAVDGAGNVTERAVVVDVAAREAWPLPYHVDWPAVAAIGDAVQVVDGRWTRSGDGIRTVVTAYDRLVAFGDLDWLDYEVSLTLTVHDIQHEPLPPYSGQPGLGLLMRWTGHTNVPFVCPLHHCGWMPHGTSAWYWWDEAGGAPGDIGGSLRDSGGGTLDFGTTYRLEMRVETIPEGSLYRYKVWPVGEPEPLGWNAVGLGDPAVPRGSALLVAHHVDVTLGEIRAAALPDVAPPSAPGGLTAEPTSAFGVRLDWLPASDDFLVVQYRVYRDGAPVGTTSETFYRDRPLAAGTGYRYHVAALDEAGNESDLSLPADAVTPEPPAGPPCGDGTQHPGEQCDDGGVADGDGCSSICLVENAVQNVLANGGFAGGTLDPWFFYTDGAASASVATGEARIQVAATGSNLQLSQAGIAVDGDTRYRVTFRGSSLDGRDAQLRLFRNTAPFTGWGLLETFDLTPVPQSFEAEFVTPPGNLAGGRFMVWLASFARAGSDYRFDDFVLQKVVGSCGNGVLDAGEACDDGDLDNSDDCLNDCSFATCGDGWLREGSEACDDGNATGGDGCSSACEPDPCGDGFLDAGEECDDGNADPTDGCALCRHAECGDGFVRAGIEACDDGNAADGDGCSSACAIEEPPEPEGPLVVAPASVVPGGSVTATWTGIDPARSTDWLGLYAAGAAPGAYSSWIYASSCTRTAGAARAAGSCPLAIPASLAPGAYEVRLYANNGFTLLATSNPFTIAPPAGPSLAVHPGTVPPGGAAVASWTGIAAPSNADWIGLFVAGAPDSAFLDWFYVSCSRSRGGAFAAGSCPLAIPATLAPGAYELRLFANNGYTRLATSPLTVAAAGGPTLAVSPTSIPRGQAVTATWSGIASPRPRDWIGLYAAGAPDTAFLQWTYVSCSQAPGAARAAGSCPFVVPASLAPGAYELRLFADNGYTRLAKSGALGVLP